MGKQIEEHPTFHDWHVKADIVLERIGERPVLIRRYYECDFCPTGRADRINVRTWKRIGRPRYLYVRGITIIRVSKEDWTRSEFMATTKLERPDIEAIESWEFAP